MVTTTGDADLVSLFSDAARWGVDWNGGAVQIRATFASADEREAAARALANVAGAPVTMSASYEPGESAPQAGRRKRPARWRTRVRAHVVTYRPRRRDPLSAPLIAVPLSLAILTTWVVAFVLFRDAGPHHHLPGVALGSKLLLDVIRATVVVGLIGTAAALIVRSAFGHFPSEISTQCLKWTQTELEERSGRQEQLTTLGALSATLHDRIEAIENRLKDK